MDLYNVLIWIALTMSILSIAIIILTVSRVYRNIELLVSELGISILTHKRYRRVKRYILVKFLCFDNNDYKTLSNYVKNSIYSLLGPVLRHRCSIEVISYRPNTGRAIIRVRGEAICVTYTLLALSIQHLKHTLGSCIAVPIRTSGLISRLRNRYLKTSR
jgi:RNase P/RNase MRP subunit POP5